MTPQQANELLTPKRYDFSYHNDFNDRYEADRDEDPDGEYVLLADVQEAIDFWNRRAPAPTEPAVDRDAILEEAAALFDQPHMEYFGCNIQEDIRALKLVTPASPAVPARDHLLKIIAFAYQIAGWHDAPEHILAVLAHPESATAAQVDAMLPYQVGGAQAVPEPAPPAPSYGPVHVVADLVRNLLTLDQALPIYSAFHVDYEGKRRCRTRAVSISKERVVDGKWVESSRKDVPYSIVVWAKPAEDLTPQVAQPSGNTGELPQVAQASQPTSAEGMTAWAAYCPAGFQFIHADQRVVEDFVYTRRYCGEGPYSIMHMKVSRPTSAEGKDSEHILVPVVPSTELVCAIELEFDNQLMASGLSPLKMQRQDGEEVWNAIINHLRASTGKDTERGAARQYYYKTNACSARSPIPMNCPYSPDCTCWHDEGAGPLANEPGSIREWRASTGKDTDKEATK